MPRPLVVFILIFFATLETSAQQVELFGYYEPQYMGISINDGYAQLFTNKLRVDLQSLELDNVTFVANFDYITYRGETEWNLLEYIPESAYADIHPTLYHYFDFVYRDSIFLDNAYLKITFPAFDITVGRQKISLGPGYAWNPTDLFNFKNLVDPTYEQPGHNAVRLDIPVSAFYGIQMMYLPESNWDSSGKLIRFKGHLKHFDYGAIYVEKPWPLSEFSSFDTIDRERRLYGGDLVGEMFGLGVWGEWGYNTLDGHNDFWEMLFGVDYTLDNGAYLLSEYYRNGLGRYDYRDYNLNDWVRYLMAEIRTISRDNLYLYIDYPLTDLIHIYNSSILSLTDMSLALVPGLNYSLRENLEMELFLGLNTGKEGKAFSSEQGQSGILRLRAYF